MALLSLSTKIASVLMASVIGSGVVAGAVVATSNKGIINNVEGEKPSPEVLGSDGSSFGNEDKASPEKDKSEDEVQETKGEKGNQPSEEIGHKSPEPEISPAGEKSYVDQSFQENNPIVSTEERHDELLEVENSEESDDDQDTDSEDLLEQQEEINQLQISDDPEIQEDSEEVKRQKEEQEFEDLGVKLEAVLIYQSSGKERMCFLSKKDDEKPTPVLMDLLDSDEITSSSDECEPETVWSGNRDIYDLRDNKEALWVRGEEEKVKEFIEKNWDETLKASNYVDKSKNINLKLMKKE